MFRNAVLIFACVASVAAKPGLLGAPLAYTVPAAVVAAPAPVVTATSSQFVARNFNGLAAAPIVAPVHAVAPQAKVVAPVAAPLAAPVAVAPHPLAPVATRFAVAPAPLVHSAPLAYAGPFAHAAPFSALPLHYAAAPSPVIL